MKYGSLSADHWPAKSALLRFVVSRRKYPRIRVSLIGGLTDTLIEQLRRGKIDFVAGVATPDWRIDDELRTENLFTVRTVVIAGRKHPLADRTDVTLEELAEYPWIVSSPKIGEAGPLPLLDVFVNAGVKPPQQLVYSNAISGSIGLLVKGDFLSLTVTQAVPMSIVAPPGHDTPFVWLNFDWPMPPIMACLTYRAGVTLARPAQLLADEIKLAARELGHMDSSH